MAEVALKATFTIPKLAGRPVVSVRRAPGFCGAEILGVDLSKPVLPETFAQIESILHDNGVVVFRNQKIEDEHQVAFSKLWGPELAVHVFTQFSKQAHPEVMILSNILNDEGKPIGAAEAARYWHSDLAYTATPSRVSLLYGVEIPMKEGQPLGDTEFAHTGAAYLALPAEVKRMIHGRRALFRATKPKTGGFSKELPKDQKDKLNDVSHPVVRVHPYTGRKTLFVSDGHTIAIEGMPEDESDALLNELFQHMQRPEFQYAHKWQPGDLLVWDNHGVIHQATGGYALPQRRLMYRTTVKGSMPVGA